MRELQMLVRRREEAGCPDCRGEGRIREKGRNDNVHWDDCTLCDGDGVVETWVYYWADSNAPRQEELDEMEGIESWRFWRRMS